MVHFCYLNTIRVFYNVLDFGICSFWMFDEQFCLKRCHTSMAWGMDWICVSGKSTLTDSLVAAPGIIAQEVAGDIQLTDTWADEAETVSPSNLQGFPCTMRCEIHL
jgi:hypothetical protein